jgi:hypothetical protein
VAFFFTGYVHTDRAARFLIEVLETEALVLWTDHLICGGIMGEEFGTISTATSGFGPSQAAFAKASEEFNASLVHGDHALMIREIPIREHLRGKREAC